MMGRRIPMKSGDEYDALSNWRKVHRLKAGTRARIKRRFRRRERRIGNREAHND